MMDHPRILDQISYQIHAVKPGLMDRSSQISILMRSGIATAPKRLIYLIV